MKCETEVCTDQFNSNRPPFLRKPSNGSCDFITPTFFFDPLMKLISIFVRCRRAAGLALLTVALAQTAVAQSGRIERGIIGSAALAGSLFSDPTNRPYAVYLPASYDEGQRRYPVFYMLHGWTENLDTHLAEVRSALDSMIRTRQIGEMVAVFVDGQNALLGSFYRTSTATGDYGTYITHDLVNLIDARYRTLATNASRGITGFSMGGYGAMHLALNYPNVFSVVVAQSGYYDTTDAVTDGALKEIARVNPMTSAAVASLALQPRALFPFLPSAVPNPSRPPYYCDAPYVYENGQYTTNQSTFLRLRDADIAHGALSRFLQQMTSLRGAKIVHGTADSLVPVSQARTLDQALLSAGLTHVYEEHAGGHQFLADRSLTFLSQALVGSEAYISPPRLALTWTADDAVMRFSTQAGVDYQVEHTASLNVTDFQWTQFAAVRGTGQVAQVSMPIDANKGFLRVSATNTAEP
jgi:enterochelin esterase-like enzyme